MADKTTKEVIKEIKPVKAANVPNNFYNQKYTPEKGEEFDVHAIIERIEFEEDLKISKPELYITNPRFWQETFLKNHQSSGYVIMRVLHYPTKDAATGNALNIPEFNQADHYDENKLRQIKNIMSGKYD